MDSEIAEALEAALGTSTTAAWGPSNDACGGSGSEINFEMLPSLPFSFASLSPTELVGLIEAMHEWDTSNNHQFEHMSWLNNNPRNDLVTAAQLEGMKVFASVDRHWQYALKSVMRSLLKNKEFALIFLDIYNEAGVCTCRCETPLLSIAIQVLCGALRHRTITVDELLPGSGTKEERLRSLFEYIVHLASLQYVGFSTTKGGLGKVFENRQGWT